MLLVFAALLLHGGDISDFVRYDGDSLVRVYPQSQKDSDYIDQIGIDRWSHHADHGIDLQISEANIPALRLSGIPYEVVLPNIQAIIDEEQQRLARRPRLPPHRINPIDDYLELDEVYAYLEKLASDFPEIVRLEEIGKSLESNPIHSVSLGPENPNRHTFMIIGMQHAREWLAHHSTLCVLDTLVNDYDENPEIKKLVDSIEFLFVPDVNPDGYKYSWSGDRLWRHNRRGSKGVDLNRNYDGGWGGPGSNFKGSAPFSEPESKAVQELAASRENIDVFVDIHAYSQLILTPYGFQNKKPDNHAIYQEYGDSIAKRIKGLHGKTYKPMRAWELYPASGVASDWAADKLKVFGFTMEVRPTMADGGGFIQNRDQILPTCEEMMEVVLELSKLVETDDSDTTDSDTEDDEESTSETSESSETTSDDTVDDDSTDSGDDTPSNESDDATQDPDTPDPDSQDPDTPDPDSQDPNTPDPDSQDPNSQDPNTQEPQNSSSESQSKAPSSNSGSSCSIPSSSAGPLSSVLLWLLLLIPQWRRRP